MSEKPLTIEEAVRYAVQRTIARAADIVEKITEKDVLTMQTKMLADGVPLTKVARIDRAMIGVAHLRAMAKK